MNTSYPRRTFIHRAAWGAGALSLLPHLALRAADVSKSSLRKIQVAQIGCGRMGMEDMRGVMNDPRARVVAVCDLDPKRLRAARLEVENHYRKVGEADHPVLATSDYRELLSRTDIDALVVSTPDHWHALPAIAGAKAGKHLYVQKPLTYSIGEAIALRQAVQKSGIVLQVGSQQRSEEPFPAFRPISEIVRAGRLGKVHTVKVGIGIDRPSGVKPPTVPDTLPSGFDFDRWLGPAPEQPYFERRVHPQADYGRPGWITTEDFGLGMITNWGAHHLDIALWALGLELSGPGQISAKAEFMREDYFTVHQEYAAELAMPNGARILLDHTFENGLRFEGDEGWAFCSRGSAKVTKSDGGGTAVSATEGPLRASRPSLLEPLPPSAQRWPKSPNHYSDWVGAIADRRPPIAPVEQAVRSLELCAATWIAMKLGRTLNWDVSAEAFSGDAEANRWCDRVARRAEYDHRLL